MVLVFACVWLCTLCSCFVFGYCDYADYQLATTSKGELSYSVPCFVLQALVGFDGPAIVLRLSYSPINIPYYSYHYIPTNIKWTTVDIKHTGKIAQEQCELFPSRVLETFTNHVSDVVPIRQSNLRRNT